MPKHKQGATLQPLRLIYVVSRERSKDVDKLLNDIVVYLDEQIGGTNTDFLICGVQDIINRNKANIVALKDGNSALRAASQIAARKGENTNWDAFRQQVKSVLASQHSLFFQTEDHADSADCWCNPRLDYVDPETGNEVYVHSKPN
jgi:hypothetical protein